MRKSMFAAAALAVAMLAAPAAFTTAQALPAVKAAESASAVTTVGRRDHHWRGGNRGWRKGWRGHRGPVIRFGWRGGGNCAWLRRKANQTGSAYWWRRYRQCRY